MELNERIAAWREHRDLTQAEVAAKMKLSPAAIAQWETGETKPTTGNLTTLVESVLDLTMERFYGRVPSRAKRVS